MRLDHMCNVQAGNLDLRSYMPSQCSSAAASAVTDHADLVMHLESRIPTMHHSILH